MTTFQVSLVARVPRVSGPPSLVEVDRLVPESISYVDELNRPGSATVTCKVGTLSPDVKERLADLGRFPSEVWIYADAALAWAGEIQTLGVQGQSVTLNSVGLLAYCARMGITQDLIFADQDQFTIARMLINEWQSKAYGHYGLVVPNNGLSGVLRDRTYLQKDLKDVLAALTELGAVLDGFDLHVSPSSRTLILSHPRRGINLSEAVVIDARTIDSGSVVQSIAPDDLVSDIAMTSSAQGADGTQISLYSYRSNTDVLTQYGRSWRGQSASDISVQTTLDSRGDAFLVSRSGQLLQPGVTLVPNIATGTAVGGFSPGDIVAYAYDAGLGMQQGSYRVSKISTTVSADGKQRLGVEFI